MAPSFFLHATTSYAVPTSELRFPSKSAIQEHENWLMMTEVTEASSLISLGTEADLGMSSLQLVTGVFKGWL